MAQTAQAIGQTMVIQNVFGQPLTIFGLPVDKETIFKNHKGWYKAAVEKRQRKLIAKTTFVNFFLNPDERIRCITTGYSPITLTEQLLTGPAFVFFKRAYFIFTNQRILHIPTRIDHQSPSAISQITYSDCRRLTIKGRSLVIEYKNGSHEVFPYIHRKERQRIKALLEKLIPPPKAAGGLKERTYVCPSCTGELMGKPDICHTCKLKFKSAEQATIRTLIIPGGGYFYNRYPVWGFVVGVLEVILFSALVFQLSNLYGGVPTRIFPIGLLAGLLSVEKIAASFHCRELTKEFIPEEMEFAMKKR
jgi:hypothetical protein